MDGPVSARYPRMRQGRFFCAFPTRSYPGYKSRVHCLPGLSRVGPGAMTDLTNEYIEAIYVADYQDEKGLGVRLLE